MRLIIAILLLTPFVFAEEFYRDDTLSFGPTASTNNKVLQFGNGATKGCIRFNYAGTDLEASDDCSTYTPLLTSSDLTSIQDSTDGDTKIQTEESADEDKIRFDTAGTERMIIDETGLVGIGTSSPATALHLNSSGNTIFRVTNPTTGTTATDGTALSAIGANSILSNNEPDGDFTIQGNDNGTNYEAYHADTSARKHGIGTGTPAATLEISSDVSGSDITLYLEKNTAVSNNFIETHSPTDADVTGFYALAVYDSSFIGGIKYASATTLSFDDGTSDARLKDNIADLNDSESERIVMGVRPRSYVWKEDGHSDFGFIAQEVKEVFPEMASGDESDDPIIKPMTISPSRLTPHMVNFVQQLKEEIELLKEEVATLKGSTYVKKIFAKASPAVAKVYEATDIERFCVTDTKLECLRKVKCTIGKPFITKDSPLSYTCKKIKE